MQKPKKPTSETNQDYGARNRGKFTTGNPGGTGNPWAPQVARLRKVLLEVVTPEEFKEVAGAILKRAKEGDLGACKMLFTYCIGAPHQEVATDTTEADLLEQFNRWATQKRVAEMNEGFGFSP